MVIGQDALSLPFLIAAVALPGFHFVLRLMSDILCERASHIHNFVELPFLVPSYKPFVFACIDQFSLARLCLCSHMTPFFLQNVSNTFRTLFFFRSAGARRARLYQGANGEPNQLTGAARTAQR
jgi:hypothetical protein